MSEAASKKMIKIMDIPSPHAHVFENGINHPLLYLWDAWSFVDGDVIHLYCLAVSRKKSDGTPLQPIERNNFPFHIRHFSSINNGVSWRDEGCFLDIDQCATQFDCHNIWSGSMAQLSDGNKLLAFTVLEQVDDEHKFLQNIALASSNDGYVVDEILDFELSSPRKDWKKITDKGYYLGKPNLMGSNDGDENGPILAWRDPFIFTDNDDKVSLFWGGKVAPAKSALVRAELDREEDVYRISKLHEPLIVPDGNEFTQLELPKVMHDKEGSLYYLMISTCKRMYEGQSDDEVDKGVRMYKSESLGGPWISLGEKILGSEHLFGPTVLRMDFPNNRLLCIAPYTDAADDKLSLTFSSVFYLYLNDLRVEFL